MDTSKNPELWGLAKNFLYTAILLVVALGVIVVSFPDGAAAILVVLILSGFCLMVFRHFTVEKEFITQVFLLALVLRLGFGIFVHLADLREFFGGDALTYDYRGNILLESWMGTLNPHSIDAFLATSTAGPGWGMYYIVATLYGMLGRNIFAAQSFCGVIGAATAPMVFFCAKRIYANTSAAKLAAVLVAVFPAFIIWSSQLLKDGLIIFLLVLTMTLVLELQERLSASAIALLGLSLVGILSLRFYIFYMVVIAVVGSFTIGVSNSTKSIVTRTAVLAILGLALTYFGVIRLASADLEKYGNLSRLQNSRLDLSRAGSGFGSEGDVSTASGAITAIPVGFLYLMFAPFPWQLGSLRQAIALPEVIIWWAMMPLLFAGLVYSIKHRLRNALPMLLFSLMLTFAYSVFQANVGTAYRQRTQIQVFLFIFIAVGWTLGKEKRADRKLARIQKQQRLEAALRSREGIRS